MVRGARTRQISYLQRRVADTYDMVVVGSGPASASFLAAWLDKAPPKAKVLWLEKGPHTKHAQRMQEGEDDMLRRSREHVNNPIKADKPWRYGIALGGSSNLWWACTPRFLPADFEQYSRYGVGRDWPIGYDELEPYYGRAEELLAVAGDSEDTPFRRSTPYPLAPHDFTEPEKLLKAAYPDQFFHQPCARPTRAVGRRPRCCANGVCGRCPVDSKFTVLNGFKRVFDDRRVELLTGAAVQAVESEAGQATGVVYLRGAREYTAKCRAVALGANAMFNAHILLRSKLPEGGVGRRLHEQASVRVFVELDGLENFQGSTSITGHGYMLYDGAHRKERAGALVETWNVPRLRMVPGRFREFLQAQFIYEDLPRPDNQVIVDPDDPTKPKLVWMGRSEYAERARVRAAEDAERVFAPLPVERIRLEKDGAFRDTEGHILGTTPMGRDPKSSVVDADLRHHQLRNLLVLGGSTFPVSGPSNPTLTIVALSLRAAARLF